MKRVIKKHVLILFVAALLLLTRCIDAKVHVQVINRLREGTRMSVHCRSREDDLGFHTLAVEDAFEWSFNLNFMETTLFYCNVRWGNSRWYHFNAYDASRDRNRCKSKCRWMVAKDERLYGYNQESGFWERIPLIVST